MYLCVARLHQAHLLTGSECRLQKQGAPQQLVRVEESELLGDQLDVTVAAQDLSPGLKKVYWLRRKQRFCWRGSQHCCESSGIILKKLWKALPPSRNAFGI